MFQKLLGLAPIPTEDGAFSRLITGASSKAANDFGNLAAEQLLKMV